MSILSPLSATAHKLPLSDSKIQPYVFQVHLFPKTIACMVCTEKLSFLQATQQQLASHMFHSQTQEVKFIPQ